MTNKSKNFLFVLLPSILLMVLCLIPLIRYPEVYENAGKEILTVFIGAIIYLVLWRKISPDRFSSNAGLWIGALLMLNTWMEDFIDWRSKNSALIFKLLLMFFIFFSFTMLSTIKGIKTGKFMEGLKSSLASALCGTFISVCFGFLVNYLAPGRINFILQNDPAINTFDQAEAFKFYRAFSNGSNLILLVPLISILLGALGGISLVFRRSQEGKYSSKRFR